MVLRSRCQFTDSDVRFIRLVWSYAGHREPTVRRTQSRQTPTSQSRITARCRGRNESNIAVLHRLLFIHQLRLLNSYPAFAEGCRKPGKRFFSRCWRIRHWNLRSRSRFNRRSWWRRFRTDSLCRWQKRRGGWRSFRTNGNGGRIGRRRINQWRHWAGWWQRFGTGCLTDNRTFTTGSDNWEIQDKRQKKRCKITFSNS